MDWLLEKEIEAEPRLGLVIRDLPIINVFLRALCPCNEYTNSSKSDSNHDLAFFSLLFPLNLDLRALAPLL